MPRARLSKRHSSSSDSSCGRGRSNYKHKRSRERSMSSSRSRRIDSPRHRRRRSYSRSSSSDRYSKSRRSPRTRSKKKSRRSHSRERSRRTRSSSRSYHKSSSYKKKKTKHRSPDRDRKTCSKSRSEDSILINKNFIIEEPAEKKIEKAIKAAEAAGLTLTKLPSYEFKDIQIKEEMPTIQDRNVLNDINSDIFIQKQFISTRTKKENIVINLDTETVKVPEFEKIEDSNAIYVDDLPTEEERKEMWFKKLYQYRKKMLKGEI